MRGLSQSSINRQQHIPQHIRQAMDQHMQTMPAHLQSQMGDGIHMSRQTQKAVSDHMQKTMPAHLKQYAGAYMEQSILRPSVSSGGVSAAAPQPHAPIPDRMRLDHSNVSAAQYDAKFHADLFAPDQPAAAEPQSSLPPESPAPPAPPPADIPPANPHGPDYGFIMQPSKPPRRSLLPDSSGPIVRVAVILGSILVLLIVFVIVKGLFFSNGGNKQALISVAQDQQAMIHIVSNGTSPDSQQQAVLSEASQNFAITAQLTLASTQNQLVTYLATNGKKVNTKTLGLKVDAMTDQQLAAAAANSTYDPTFKHVMQTKLTDYQAALREAYKQTKGPKGRKLLTQEYQASRLLLTQLNSPAS